MLFNKIEFHQNPLSSSGGDALTRYVGNFFLWGGKNIGLALRYERGGYRTDISC